ncbi:hypothetical protein Sjap_016528 [Stephania japonica]|uniref:Inositol-pentakisphosphate 2-kinase n=1 Tax=Stephania japonica TaxID=461633 RepID=A0AAP0NV25_9MAGN
MVLARTSSLFLLLFFFMFSCLVSVQSHLQITTQWSPISTSLLNFISIFEKGVSCNVTLQEHMEMIPERSDAADWIYKCEGAANVILGYRVLFPKFWESLAPEEEQLALECFKGVNFIKER